MEHVIQIQDVSYRRGDQGILKNISWSVKKGEHWAILGLNGSGKTTLLNIINGYMWPTSGKVAVLEESFGSVDLRELRTSIGWVSSSLQDKLYAQDKAENIVVSGKYASIGLYDTPSDEDWNQADQLMVQLQCSHLKGRVYQSCSQGEKQKLLIARALMASPKLLILDEPCNGLDLFSRERLLEAIQQLAEDEGAPTLLFVTHHTEEILPMFRHALLLRRGEVFMQGDIQQLLTSERLSRFFETPVEAVRRDERIWLLPLTKSTLQHEK
ncbi:ABC transporter ATP-binding protein [Paenibacillus hexagrammi]|uniref:ABC transporter ATP-binding protein n=1 Tax=Paenibacillus hexagrammi TaxID=2908839 RepID=A0ABY3SPP2_9BACL|nr:ABC transporter ATP-binding protein [Paenibacillus sp. YPD9-1]UJF35428.1 ABC transporter ATP-binding protein [Paenibacillus sp. YPD9-1]